MALVLADQFAEALLQEGGHHDVGHDGIAGLDGAGEVARHDAFLLLLERGKLQVVLDEGFGIFLVQVGVELGEDLSALSHELHHLYPRSDFGHQFGAFAAGKQCLGRVDHEVELSLEGGQGFGVVARSHLGGEIIGYCLECHRLVRAAQAVGVAAEVYVVLAEYVEGFVIFGHQIADGPLPGRIAVVGSHVPGVVGDAVEGEHRGFGVLHRVGGVAAQHVGDVEVIAVGGAHQQVADAVVRHGIVEPDVGFATDARVDPVEVGLVDEIHDAVAGPHDADLFVHVRLECAEVGGVVARPAAVVLRGAHDERLHVVVLLYKLVCDVVEQLCLLHTTGSLAENIVEEDSKTADAQCVHAFQFLHYVE